MRTDVEGCERRVVLASQHLLLVAAVLVGAVACARPVAHPARGAAVGIASVGAPLAELAPGPHLFGWLINGDTEQRHRDNIDAAARALSARGAPSSHVVISDGRDGHANGNGLAATARAFGNELGPDDQLIVYVTGHGSPEGIVLQRGEVLPRDRFVGALEPLKNKRTVFVFDGCFTGALPSLLEEKGFQAIAMAPVAEGQESQCQLFAPVFWAGIELGVQAKDQRADSLRDVFRYAMAEYNRGRAHAGLPATTGAYVSPLPEARTAGEIGAGCAVVEIGAAWCAPCAAQRRELSFVDLYRDEGVHVFTVDIEHGPLRDALPGLLGRQVEGLPTLAFFKDGRVVESVQGARSAPEVLARVRQVCGIDATKSPDAHAAWARRLAARDVDTRAAAIEALVRVGAVDGEVSRAFDELAQTAEPGRLAALVDRLATAPDLAALLRNARADTVNRAFGAPAASVEARVALAVSMLDASDVPRAMEGLVALGRVADDRPTEVGVLWPAVEALWRAVAFREGEVRRISVCVLTHVLERWEWMSLAWWAAAHVAYPEATKAETLGTEALRTLLQDPDPNVRASAAFAAGAHVALIPLVATRVLSDPSPLVRRYAARGLRVRPHPEATAILLRAFRDTDALARRGALDQTRTLESTDIVDAIAWTAVGPGRDKRALRAAMASPWARSEIARAYGLLFAQVPIPKDPELLPILVQLLDADRFWAPVAFVHFDDPRVVPALLQRARAKDAAKREIAIWALGQLTDPRSVEAVRAAQKDPSARVRKVADDALREGAR
jgi:thioredoxin 1